MKKHEKINNAIKAVLDECVKKMHVLYKEEEITDFYIQVNTPGNVIRIVDDDDRILASVELSGQPEEDEANEAEEISANMVQTCFQDELARLNEEKAFDDVNVFHPFSFIMEDEEGCMNDLLIIDDANLIIDDELLKGLDDDLDSFIDKLLSE